MSVAKTEPPLVSVPMIAFKREFRAVWLILGADVVGALVLFVRTSDFLMGFLAFRVPAAFVAIVPSPSNRTPAQRKTSPLAAGSGTFTLLS